MNFFSIIWMKIVGLFKEANLKPLDPVPVHAPDDNAEEVDKLLEDIEKAKMAGPLGGELIIVDPAMFKELEKVILEVEPFNKQLTVNFHLDEFGCHDGTAVPPELYGNVLELAQNLQILRDTIGKPVKIVSGYRHLEYNKKIGGARKSKHMEAMAADIRVKGIGPKTLATKIETLIKEGLMQAGGVGRYPNFTHYDVRGTNARWGGTRKTN